MRFWGWFAFFAVVALLWTDNSAGFPHYDRPGYHHCPVTARIGPGDCHGGSVRADINKADTILAGLAPDLRRDYEHWISGYREHRAHQCQRWHVLYVLRHGFGGAPDERPGEHGCTAWRDDARWHEEHPKALRLAIHGASWLLT